MRYKVTVLERVQNYRSKLFEADSPEEARELAEADDWSEWESTYDNGEIAIEAVEAL